MVLIGLIAIGIVLLGMTAWYALPRGSARSRSNTVANIERLHFDSKRDLLKYMQEERIGYISVEGGAKWEAKDLRQQGIVNLLREKYFALQAEEQRSYFTELSTDYVAQAEALMASRDEHDPAGYRSQLSKLLIYVKDPDCRARIRAELDIDGLDLSETRD